LRLDVGSRTDVGRVRENNEDSYRVIEPLQLFIVSDGMGGEAHGEIASALAVETVAEDCQASLDDPQAPPAAETRPGVSARTNRLANALHLANRRIYESALQHPEQRGMGATIVAAWANGPLLSIAHVGDSRIYLLRGGELQQLTADHSLVAEQVRTGLISKQQAEVSELQNVLTRALGPHAEVPIDAAEHPLQPGDAIVLCTDGLTRMVSDEEIASVVATHPAPQDVADRLVELANENGGTDNITVIVVRLAPQPDGLIDKLKRWTGAVEKKPDHADDTE
jgi:serine/threonine protein phosphatase PrpC